MLVETGLREHEVRRACAAAPGPEARDS
jgi:hypothetical protein